MNTPQKIGLFIKNLRTKRGLSQEQLSIQSGVDQHYVSNIENGQRNLSVEMVERLATFFGYTLSRFFVEVDALEENTITNNSSDIAGGSEVERFSQYMSVRNLSESTINRYSINVPNSHRVKAIIRSLTDGRTDDMYHVHDEVLIENIIREVADSEFDKVGQRMYSCGLRKYLLYLRDTQQ